MRVYKTMVMLSVPDEIDPGRVCNGLDRMVEDLLGGTVVYRVLTELTEEALPTPEAPVEIKG